MGKTKPIASKEKQVKAANSSSSRKHKTAFSTFGIPVTKGSGGFAATLKRCKQLRVDTTHSNTDNNKTNNYKLQFRRPRHVTTQLHDLFTQPKDQEHRDFEEECTSLRERQSHSKNVRLSSKATNKSKPQHELTFFPSTLEQGADSDKSRSTEDLIMDTTNRLSFSSINIGRGGGFLQLEPQQWGDYELKQQQQQPSNFLQTMATKIRRDERVNLLAETADNNTPVTSNKFWALQDDNSDEENAKGSGDSPSRFHFTPATFSVAPPPSSSTTAV